MMPANTGQFLKMKERTEVKHFLFFKKITFHRVSRVRGLYKFAMVATSKVSARKWGLLIVTVRSKQEGKIPFQAKILGRWRKAAEIRRSLASSELRFLTSTFYYIY